MKKAWLLILLFVANNIYCDNIIYVVTQDSVLYNRNAININVKKGDILFSQGNIDLNYIDGYRIFVRNDQGFEGFIDSNHILLQDNEQLSYLLTSKHWIFSYYLEILSKNNGEELFKHEPFWNTDYENYSVRADGFSPHWSFRFYPICFNIQNNVMEIYSILYSNFIQFVYTNQYEDNNIIFLELICINKSSRPQEHFLNRMFNIGEKYILILKIDGDYMDVYVGDETNKISTLIGVDDNFKKIIRNISARNTNYYNSNLEISDIFRITHWPRRADGSMDYPPPFVNNSNAQSSSQEIEQTLDSEITLENESAQTTKDSQFPLWLFIGGGLVLLVAVGVGVVVKRKK